MNPDTCFVITGLLEEEYITPLLKTYESIPHKIYSSWVSTEKRFLDILKKAGFTIVLSDEPDIKVCVNFINKCTFAGCKKAKELGYKYAVRSRTDIWSWDMIKFVNCARKKYAEKLTVLAGETSIDGKNNHYLHDSIMLGPIDEMISFRTPLQPEDDTRFPEQFLQETWSGKTDLTRKDICELFNFCAEDARKAGVQIVWNPKKGLFELIFDLTMRPWFFTEP